MRDVSQCGTCRREVLEGQGCSSSEEAHDKSCPNVAHSVSHRNDDLVDLADDADYD